MQKLIPIIAAGVICGSATAYAANLAVHQKGRAFSSDIVTIRKGETVTFVNDDSVPHSVLSASRGNEFNLGSQRPGTSTDVTFNELGEAKVICAIHPRMNMTVKVME